MFGPNKKLFVTSPSTATDNRYITIIHFVYPAKKVAHRRFMVLVYGLHKESLFSIWGLFGMLLSFGPI